MSTSKITCLLNWKATPYHIPIYLAQEKGFFADEGIQVAILTPNDPSDVTEIIGSGKIDIGCKAMIHTIAGKARGYPIKSFGSLLDEPFTGVIYLKGSGITEDFQTLKGKRIGYVGEFGKIQIDELTKYYNMAPEDYTAVRCGMNISKALIEGTIDAGIGLENVQQVELEEWCKSQGRDPNDVKMLRIDELAELGCCCFCSILFIGNEEFIKNNPKKIAAFMRAVKKANDLVLAEPVEAFKSYVSILPEMGSKLNKKIYERSFAYFSKDLLNVERDWNKVTNYAKRLAVVPSEFVPNYTNEFCDWKSVEDSISPTEKQKKIADIQRFVSVHGGVFSGHAERAPIEVSA